MNKNKIIEKILNKYGVDASNFEDERIPGETFSRIAATLDNHGIDAFLLLDLYGEGLDDNKDSIWSPKFTYGSMDWNTFVDAIENGMRTMSNKKLTLEALKKIVKEEIASSKK